MTLRVRLTPTETRKQRSLQRRMAFLHGTLLVAFLLIVARLIDLQILHGADYRARAQAQHFGDVVLPARRGEILARSSRTGDPVSLATNVTLDLAYVDPLVTDDPAAVARVLSETLITSVVHDQCKSGSPRCPRELIPFYAAAFDPLRLARRVSSGTLLEPIPALLPSNVVPASALPDLASAREQFARAIAMKIGEKRVTFVPLKYGASKVAMRAVDDLAIVGVSIVEENNLIHANPEAMDQGRIATSARALAPVLGLDPSALQDMLRARPLRYVPVQRRLSPELSLKLKEVKLRSAKETQSKRAQARTQQEAERIQDPLRGIALIPEHWRFYPDGTVASQVVGFLNANQEAQYGIERTFDPILRGQEGLIRTVSDPQGGQLVRAEQTIINPRDGDTIALTIDPFIQQGVERILAEAVEKYAADSGQVIVMDPATGRILAMANAPLFPRDEYGLVFEKEAIVLPPEKEREVVIEVYHPGNNVRIVKAYLPDVQTSEGRAMLSAKTRRALEEAEALYDLEDISRYFLYVGENTRREIFRTDIPGVWLKYRNNLGVGAYLNRAIQEIYEPGSVMKPITMAIALDEGELTPEDTYDDLEDVKVDEYTIKNALLIHYGKVTMTQCLAYSINTCMTSVSAKLGRKLFHRMLERFGFGHITGIELEDELPGEILPWRQWSNALLATAAFGQGISVTPLQMITAFAALANGGKLLYPTIVDRVIHADGTSEQTPVRVLDQVITSGTSDTITAMLVNSVESGYAKTARVNGYRIAGKTGTSQIAGPGGKYESGTGSTIASFIGYAPALHPRFVVLVKLDRPKNKLVVHGAGTAAPTFKEIAILLFKYYGIPPDDGE